MVEREITLLLPSPLNENQLDSLATFPEFLICFTSTEPRHPEIPLLFMSREIEEGEGVVRRIDAISWNETIASLVHVLEAILIMRGEYRGEAANLICCRALSTEARGCFLRSTDIPSIIRGVGEVDLLGIDKTCRREDREEGSR
jgi:hypothetical protein